MADSRPSMKAHDKSLGSKSKTVLGNNGKIPKLPPIIQERSTSAKERRQNLLKHRFAKFFHYRPASYTLIF